MEDAITPMKKDIYKSLPKVEELVKKAVNRAGKKEKVIIIGIGNSCGVGDNKKEVSQLKGIIEKLDKRERTEKSKEKGGWF